MMDMREQEYRTVMSETYRERGTRYESLYVEKEKREKKERAKWLDLLFKIKKIKTEN